MEEKLNLNFIEQLDEQKRSAVIICPSLTSLNCKKKNNNVYLEFLLKFQKNLNIYRLCGISHFYIVLENRLSLDIADSILKYSDLALTVAKSEKAVFGEAEQKHFQAVWDKAKRLDCSDYFSNDYILPDTYLNMLAKADSVIIMMYRSTKFLKNVNDYCMFLEKNKHVIGNDFD